MPDNPSAPPPSVGDRAAYQTARFIVLFSEQPWSKILAAFFAGILVGLWGA